MQGRGDMLSPGSRWLSLGDVPPSTLGGLGNVSEDSDGRSEDKAPRNDEAIEDAIDKHLNAVRMWSLKGLLRSVSRSGGTPLSRKHPLLRPKRSLPAAVEGMRLSGKTVAETIQDTLDGLRRRGG